MQNNNVVKKDHLASKLSAQGILPFWPNDLFEFPNVLVRSGVFSISRQLKHYSNWTPVPAWGVTNIEMYGPQLGEDHKEVWEQLLSYKRGQPITRPLFLHTNQLLRELSWDISGKQGAPGGTQYKKLNKIIDELDRAKMRISDPKLLQNLVFLYKAFQREAAQNDPKLASVIQTRYGQQISEIVRALQDGDEYMLTMNFIAATGTNKRKKRAVIEIDPIVVIMFDGINTTLINRQARKEMSTTLGRAVLLFVESHTGEIPNMRCSTWQGLVGSSMKNKRQFKTNLRKSLVECEEKGFIWPNWDFYEADDGEWGTYGIIPTKKLRRDYRKAMEKANQSLPSSQDSINLEDSDWNEQSQLFLSS